jgi:hypothetical protein
MRESMHDKPLWTVFVGGGEVNDYLLPLQAAQDLANSYEAAGYRDVAVEMVRDN